MANILFIKMSDGNVMTHCRMDQNYGDAAAQQATVDACMAEHHSDKTVTAWTIADSTLISDQIKAGLLLDSDFQVVAKADIPAGDVGIAPVGQTMNDLDDTDLCVCYTPPA